MSIELVRDSHLEALYAFGEFNIFFLMWRVEDFENGLVARCSSCFTSYGAIATDTYKQSPTKNCDSCFGTTFEGGYKAKIIRPAIWSVSEPKTKPHQRGEISSEGAEVQTTSDFQLNVGDYILRADGTRWRMRGAASSALHTGFQLASHERTRVGYIYGQVDKEDKASVAFLLPPTDAAELHKLLTPRGDRVPDFSDDEEFRGSLYADPEPQLHRPFALDIRARVRAPVEPS